jgi:[ribosomal protein S5]-alanine N-acetyltransferase
MQLPPQPIIETKRLIIRLVEKSDLADLLVVNSDDEVTRYLPYASWKDIADAEAWFERAMTRHAKAESWQFVITLRESGRAIGTCLLFHFNDESARAELGYALGKPHWGAGYMLEATRAFIAFAFEHMHLRRIEAEIDPRNTASSKLLERLGFVKEGLLRERWAEKNGVSDSALYGLLRTAWLVNSISKETLNK